MYLLVSSDSYKIRIIIHNRHCVVHVVCVCVCLQLSEERS